MLSHLLAPFEFGLGGPFGSGRQWMSWIERDDLVRLIAHIVATPQLIGAVNATAPAPVRNATFAQELARALHRPALLRMPAFLLHALAGVLADELLLGGRRVLPDKAQASGFKFRHETLPSALSAILGRDRARRRAHLRGRQRNAGEAARPQLALFSPTGSAQRRPNILSMNQPSSPRSIGCGRTDGPPTGAGGAVGVVGAGGVGMNGGGNADASDGPPAKPGSAATGTP